MAEVGFHATKLFIDGYDENKDYSHAEADLADWRNTYEAELEDRGDDEFFSCYLVALKDTTPKD